MIRMMGLVSFSNVNGTISWMSIVKIPPKLQDSIDIPQSYLSLYIALYNSALLASILQNRSRNVMLVQKRRHRSWCEVFKSRSNHTEEGRCVINLPISFLLDRTTLACRGFGSRCLADRVIQHLYIQPIAVHMFQQVKKRSVMISLCD